MLKTGDRIHFKNPDFPDKRILLSGEISEVEDDGCTAAFPKPSFEIAANAELIVFYELRRKFVQQVARITESTDEESGISVTMSFVGDPGPAEGREHYRVTTISADVTATLADETGCDVQDVSATGFAAISSAEYSIGTTLDASIAFEDLNFSGKVSVQSIQKRTRGRSRYGLRCVKDGPGESKLLVGLQEISLAVQRQQLQRQAGDG